LFFFFEGEKGLLQAAKFFFTISHLFSQHLIQEPWEAVGKSYCGFVSLQTEPFALSWEYLNTALAMGFSAGNTHREGHREEI